MGCYIVPAVAAVMHYVMRKKNDGMKTKHHKWLNLLFAGGAIFGVVDHLWNGELFLFNNLWDFALGAVITLTILGVWGIMVYHDRLSQSPASALN